MLFPVLLLLAGCTDVDREMERAMALRSQILSAQECSFDVAVTADYGDQIHMFSMDCGGNAQGELTFCVTEPDTIAGITGHISEDGGKLTFADTVLAFPLLAEEQLSPVSAPWILFHTLRSGCLTSACMEEGLLRLTIDDSYEEDALHLDVWLDDRNLPVRADILFDGRRILSLTVDHFQIR